MKKVLVLVMLILASVYLVANVENAIADLTVSCTPDPFEDTTTITVSIPEDSKTEILVLDEDDNLVKSIAKRRLASGTYTFTWNGEDIDGTRQKAGDYFISVKTNFTYVKVKVILK